MSLFLAALLVPLAVAHSAASALTKIQGPTTVPDGWVETLRPVDLDSLKVPVYIALKRADFSPVSKAFYESSDPSHPRYGKHLSHAEVEAAVRPPSADIQQVIQWINRAGATDVSLHRHGDSLTANLSGRGAQEICGSILKEFRNSDTGQHVIAAVDGVFVPSFIADKIDLLGGFTGFPIPLRRNFVKSKAGQNIPMQSSDKVPKGVNPLVIRKVYGIEGFPSNSTSKKNIQAIAQFSGEFYIDADIAALCKRYGLGHCQISKLIGDNSGGNSPDESNLDTEYTTSGVAGTDIETWVYGYKGMKLQDFCVQFPKLLSDVVSEDEHPWVVSVSYGSQKIGVCPTTAIKRAEEDAQKLGAMGVTLIIASGDDGSGQDTRQGSNGGWLAPSWPSTMQSALSVGSTFFENGLSGPEEATKRFGSGGGFSTDYSIADWQNDAVQSYLQKTKLPSGVKYCVPGHGEGWLIHCNGTGRATPDVAFLGDGFDVIAMGTNWTVGGTSASAPGWAAVVSLLNQERLASGGTTLGHIAPLLYANPSALNDITKGTNAVKDASGHGGEVGWNCEEGWDAVSGLGTPNFPKLLQLVKSLSDRNM